MTKEWILTPRTEDDIVRQLLVARGIPVDAQAEFLAPNWETGTHSPWLFTKMRAAVDRIFAALASGERIVIHGDYDADGVSGATLLYDALRQVASRAKWQADIGVFLPDREKDGYGVAMHTIERLASEGTKLLITVDCGIANADQLDRAQALGVDVVICDHHQLGDRLPAFAHILHPLAPGEMYPNKTLCGTGVAFKLASALLDEARTRGYDFPVGYEKWFLDLVAIATVTDVMPLLGENRVLEHFGLSVLRKTRRPGLLAILSSAGVDPDAVDTETIGFRIGPRLNAAGRLSSALFAFTALSAESAAEAVPAAAKLETLNRERQAISAAAYVEAGGLLVGQETASILVAAKSDWLPGIVGLVAGRLVNEFGVPAFAFAKVGDHYVGSGRSVGGLHLVEAMNSCGDIFLKKGGHPQACGLTIAGEENLQLFAERVALFAANYFQNTRPTPKIAIDAELPFAQATWDMFTDIMRCAPFGEGNRAPVFVAHQASVLAAETMGSKHDHLRLTLGGVKPAKAIGFGLGAWATELHLGDLVDVAYTLEVNEWNGRKELQYRIVDIRRADGGSE